MCARNLEEAEQTKHMHHSPYVCKDKKVQDIHVGEFEDRSMGDNGGTVIKSKSLKVLTRIRIFTGQSGSRIRIYVVLCEVNITYVHITLGFSVTIPTSRFLIPPVK